MATAYENLIKHLKLALRQLEQLKTIESILEQDEMCDLIDAINSLALDLVTPAEST